MQDKVSGSEYSRSGERSLDCGCSIRKVTFDVRDIGRFIGQLRTLAEENLVQVVLFDADKMAGESHVVSALFHAGRAIGRGETISSSFEIEALLYASASRQCQEAVKFGVHEGRNRCYLCICPENGNVWGALSGLMTETCEDWEILDDEKKHRLMGLFGITPAEIAVTGESLLQDLVLERVALLEVNK